MWLKMSFSKSTFSWCWAPHHDHQFLTLQVSIQTLYSFTKYILVLVQYQSGLLNNCQKSYLWRKILFSPWVFIFVFQIIKGIWGAPLEFSWLLGKKKLFWGFEIWRKKSNHNYELLALTEEKHCKGVYIVNIRKLKSNNSCKHCAKWRYFLFTGSSTQDTP